jgi:hypothetical protein
MPDVSGPLPNPPPQAGEGACSGELRTLPTAPWNCGRGGTVDATDLKNLSARGETRDAELLKVGETCQMAIPSQAR